MRPNKSFLLILILISTTLGAFNVFSIEQTGVASWYGPNFHGKMTANGEIYNSMDFTAAHRTLPLGSIVKVISLENNKATIVRINDRGPFAKNRIIDLSHAAAREMDMVKKGTMKVRVVLLEKGDNKYHRWSGKQYNIQVGSFSDGSKAERVLTDLINKGFNAVIRTKKLDNGPAHRILIENLTYSELQLNRVKLHNNGINDFFVTKKR